MNFKKSVAIAAAAGALAAISVPAMALENEFHGIYMFNATFSNFMDGGSGDFTPAGKRQNLEMNNFFDQRARLQYTAKANDDLKLVTHFEIDSRFGTQRTAGVGNAGGLLETDTVNLETKHVYLDFNIGKDFNAKLGLMPYQDTIKGLFITADVPAIVTTTTVGAYKLGLGFSRFDDDGTNPTGTIVRLGGSNKDLFIMDNTFAISKDTKAALSYYFLADYAAGTTGGIATILDLAKATNPILLHTFALSGESKMGPATLSGFAAMQAGHQKFNTAGVSNNTYFHGYAANVAAKVAVGSGTAKTALLFTSGDNDNRANNNNGWATSSTTSYNEGGMMIITRSTANSPTSNDRYLRRNLTNVALLSMGYDANLTDKLFANANLGFGWVPASAGSPKNAQTGKHNGCDLMGTEINLETGYKLYSNLTLKAQAAYMFLGGYYKNSATTTTGLANNPENPYAMRLHAQFSF
jgi:hypothetical protein